MKAPTDKTGQEELDLLVFEYLEGEMSEEEGQALEAKLAQDPNLLEELESWKASYVEKDFYDTALLENKLLAAVPQQPAYFSFASSLNALGLSFLTALMGFMLMTDSSQKPVAIIPEPAVHSTQDQKAELRQEAVGDQEGQEAVSLEMPVTVAAHNSSVPQKLAKAKTSGATATHAAEALPEKIRAMELPLINPIPIDLTVSPGNKGLREIKMKRVKLRQQESNTTISRKQQRIIAKKKDKALQERRAREFMKGKVPYVVPLDSKNF